MFIILFWIPEENIKIVLEGVDSNCNHLINIKDILYIEKKIESVKNFINKMVEKTSLLEINNFFYDNIRCFSLYYSFCDYYQNK